MLGDSRSTMVTSQANITVWMPLQTNQPLVPTRVVVEGAQAAMSRRREPMGGGYQVGHETALAGRRGRPVGWPATIARGG